MKQFVKILALILFAACSARAQNSWFSGLALGINPFTAPNPGGTPGPVYLSYAPVRICNLPLTQTQPCLPLATVTDLFGNPLSVGGPSNFGQLTTNVVGGYQFGCQPGQNIQIQVAPANSATPSLSFPATCPSGAGAISLGGNNAWTGNETHSGSEVFSGPVTANNAGNAFTGALTCNSLNGIICADQQSGSDPCAKITTSLGLSPSAVLATGFSGSVSCASTLTINKNVPIYFGPSVWTFNGNPGIAVAGSGFLAPSLFGAGQGGNTNTAEYLGTTRFVYGGASGGDLLRWGNQSDHIQGGGISSLTLDGGGLAQNVLHVTDAEAFDFRDLYLRNALTTSATRYILFDNNLAPANPTGVGTTENVYIHQSGSSGSATGIELAGNATAGVSMGTMFRLRIEHCNGDGVRVTKGDGGVYVSLYTFTSGGGCTGHGVNIDPVNANDPVASTFINPILQGGGYFDQTQGGLTRNGNINVTIFGYARNGNPKPAGATVTSGGPFLSFNDDGTYSGRLFNFSDTGSPPTSCSATGAGTGASCSLQAGSTNTNGVMIIATGTTPSALGTVVLNYSTTYGFNSTTCQMEPTQSGGSAWAQLANVLPGANSTSSVTGNWGNNGTNLTASSNYTVNYWCFPR